MFDDPGYVRLEAARSGGAAVTLDVGAGRTVALLRREIAPGAGEFDAISVYGYPSFPRTGSDDDLRAGLTTLQRAGRDAGLVTIYLRLQPEVVVPPGVGAGMAGTEVGRVVAVDLTRSWDELLAGYRSQLRYDVRKFRELYAVERSAARSAEFATLYSANMDRVGAAAAYYFTAEYLAALADMDGVAYWFLRTDDGELAAAAIVVDEGDSIYYHLGASHPEHARRGSMKVLLSRIIEHHADRSWRQLILGGGLGGKDDSLMRFKRGFSPIERRVFAVRIVCDPERYRALGGTDDLATGFFPAYRAG